MISKQEDSKHRILEAAKHCFATNGYNRTSIRQICETADANLALVSYYFGSKEQLYYTVIERLYTQASQAFVSDLSLDDPQEALQYFIMAFLRMRREDKLFLMLLKYELASDNPRGERIRQIIAPYFTHLERIITAGKQKGTFHYDSLEHTLTFITSILVFPALDSFLLPTHDTTTPISDELEQTTRFIFSGLRCPL